MSFGCDDSRSDALTQSRWHRHRVVRSLLRVLTGTRVGGRDHLLIRDRRLARSGGQPPRQPARRSRHHERQPDLDHQVGRHERHAAKRLRLHRDDAAAVHAARAGPVLLARDVHASELRGRRSFVDLGSARRRPRDQRRWRPTPSVDVHLHVQPRGDPEQPESVSLSDAARRGVHGPRDDRRLADADDVQRRWRGLHVVDELPQQRQSGVRVHHARRRHDQQLGPRRAIHVAESAARHAGAHDGQVGPGDDESGRARRFHAERAEPRRGRRVQRHVARSAAGQPDRRHVRHDAANLERACVRSGRRDADRGQRSTGPGDRLHARVQRRRVRAHADHVDCGVGDRRRRPTPDRHVSHAARLAVSVRRRADERGRRDRSGTTARARIRRASSTRAR